MIIYSFIPFVAIYAGWRIQKFWVILIINVGVAVFTKPIFDAIAFPYDIIVNLAVQIPISIFVVRHFARKYNEKIAHSQPPAAGP